jgi:hypothetical protein
MNNKYKFMRCSGEDEEVLCPYRERCKHYNCRGYEDDIFYDELPYSIYHGSCKEYEEI